MTTVHDTVGELYPLKFQHQFKEKVWGGENFFNHFHIDLPEKRSYGELWEVSSHPKGMSKVVNGPLKGQSLQELVDQYREQLVGQPCFDKYGTTFPLLIKFLDINDKLSIQVHPDNDYALARTGEFGKFESWFIIKATDEAKIILGTREGVTAETFKEQIDRNDFSGLFREVGVGKNDFIDIIPGTVHASLEGSILLCEIQMNSDVTYRIYDFDREFEGKKRELHLEEAMDVIDFKNSSRVVSEKVRDLISHENYSMEVLTKNSFYTIHKLEIDGSYRDTIYSNFTIYSIIDGKGVITAQGREYSCKSGDTYLIPANIQCDLAGNFTVIKSFV